MLQKRLISQSFKSSRNFHQAVNFQLQFQDSFSKQRGAEMGNYRQGEELEEITERTTVVELLLRAGASDKRLALLYYKRASRRCIYRRAPAGRSSLSLAPRRATLLLLLAVVLSKRDVSATNVPQETILAVLCREGPRRPVNNFIR